MKMRDSGGAGSQPLSPLLYSVQHLPAPRGVTRISLPRFAGEVPPNGGGGGSSCYLFKLRSLIKF